MKNKTSILLLFLTFLFVSVGNADAQQKHEYVDLGLPSGTLWATCNVGAANPWDYGDYFAWGEIETKTYYEWAYYKYANGNWNKLTLYCNKYSSGNKYFHDTRTTLEKFDDVAYINWGSDWCMPTQMQCQELKDKCSWTWTSRNNKNGYEVKGPNGNTIFLPAGGNYFGKENEHVGEYGSYWLSSIDTISPHNAHILWFTSTDISGSEHPRFKGLSVRPVRNNKSTSQTTSQNHGDTNAKYVDLGLPSGTKWATCNVGATAPWDYGEYFAWGDLYDNFFGHCYGWSNYTYANGSSNSLTAYCNSYTDGNMSFTDLRTTLAKYDDVAYQKWGGDWCMPTMSQWQELSDKCSWSWTTHNGVEGYEVKGGNGNSIFLPAGGAGGINGLFGIGKDGLYWSSSLNANAPDNAYCLEFDSNSHNIRKFCRYYGFSVRPVRNNGVRSQTNKYVDLGLPSGTKWATCNVGATTPGDYGDYFAWGETTTKSTYSWSYYKYANGNSENPIYDKLTKYSSHSSYGNNGFTDNRTSLEKNDDVAYLKWGSNWCMPTSAQWQELKDKCTWTWTSCNGNNGFEVRGPNGNTIFLPAAGYMGGKTADIESRGYYWSSSLDKSSPSARCLYFYYYSGRTEVENSYSARFFGHSVRPVRSKN